MFSNSFSLFLLSLSLSRSFLSLSLSFSLSLYFSLSFSLSLLSLFLSECHDLGNELFRPGHVPGQSTTGGNDCPVTRLSTSSQNWLRNDLQIFFAALFLLLTTFNYKPNEVFFGSRTVTLKHFNEKKDKTKLQNLRWLD